MDDQAIKRGAWIQIGLAYASFVALGMPGGLLGVAWPSAMRSFGLSLDDVGAVLIALTAGSLLSGFASGPVMARLGAGVFLAASSAAAAMGLLLFATAPSWWVAVAASILVGVGAGGTDSALNVHFAENHGSRLMNWLHACFGLGATLGPAVMTGLLTAGRSWRWGYAVVAAAQALMALCFGMTASRWRQPTLGPSMSDRAPARDVRLRTSLRRSIVWLGVVVFFVAAGVEAVAGQWPFSLFTEARGVSTVTAGAWLSAYWGALTIGRILYGLAGSNLNEQTALRVGMVAVVFGSGLLWVRSPNLVSFLGLALVGLAISPVLPLVHLLTPRRVGRAHTANTIGLQTAAGYTGVGVFPSLAGIFAERLGLETVGPFMVVCSIVMLAGHELIVRSAAPGQGRQTGGRPGE
jgi:fucose permease